MYSHNHLQSDDNIYVLPNELKSGTMVQMCHLSMMLKLDHLKKNGFSSILVAWGVKIYDSLIRTLVLL